MYQVYTKGYPCCLEAMKGIPCFSARNVSVRTSAFRLTAVSRYFFIPSRSCRTGECSDFPPLAALGASPIRIDKYRTYPERSEERFSSLFKHCYYSNVA